MNPINSTDILNLAVTLARAGAEQPLAKAIEKLNQQDTPAAALARKALMFAASIESVLDMLICAVEISVTLEKIVIEAGVLVGHDDGPSLHWHLPPGRTGGSLPDSANLWDVIWQWHEDGCLDGFAHSHPGSGVPGPSYTDLTTFAAIEAALGRRLLWWITSSDHVIRIDWTGPGKFDYTSVVIEEPYWAPELREMSK